METKCLHLVVITTAIVVISGSSDASSNDILQPTDRQEIQDQSSDRKQFINQPIDRKEILDQPTDRKQILEPTTDRKQTIEQLVERKQTRLVNLVRSRLMYLFWIQQTVHYTVHDVVSFRRSGHRSWID